MPTSAPEGPLTGLLVADFSRVLAGPFATMMLADLGARVVKVEHPRSGDDSRSYGPFVDGRSVYFARVNRGKQSVALDLKDPDDLAVARRLVARADVLVENYRPGVMARLGLGPQELLAAHPGLVYCSVSGFGHTGPWSQRPAYDAVVQAMSGIMAITGQAGGEPVKPGVPIADLSAGLYAYGGITAALLGRARTGRGTHLDVAMYDATTSLLESPALSYLSTGVEPGPLGNGHFSIAPFDTFACADRQIVVCAANDALFGALARALGRPELLDDPRYADNALRHRHRAALTADLEAVLGTEPARALAGRAGPGRGAGRPDRQRRGGGRQRADRRPADGGRRRRAGRAGDAAQAQRLAGPGDPPGRSRAGRARGVRAGRVRRMSRALASGARASRARAGGPP